jgi:hypothetical protein
LGLDALQVPVPGPPLRVESDQALVEEEVEELEREEGIAPGLLVNAPGEGAGLLPRAMESVRDESMHVRLR